MSSTPRGAVVVTGASSGIGEACARHLAGLGFEVFAGVRNEEDGERLRADASGRVVPLRIDVTEGDSIAAAAREVAAALGERPLAGLVNNAGIAVPAPLEFVPIEDFRRQLDVNVTGHVAVTQALLPLLRSARGRIVFVGSIGGRVAIPLLGAYHASKFALEGISDTWRRELRPWGIEVAIVEPGTIATPIWDKGMSMGDDLMARMGPDAERRYGKLAAAVRAASARGAVDGLPPAAVAKDVAHALTARRPRTRYLVGREAKVRALVATLLPDRAMDAIIARAMR